MSSSGQQTLAIAIVVVVVAVGALSLAEAVTQKVGNRRRRRAVEKVRGFVSADWATSSLAAIALTLATISLGLWVTRNAWNSETSPDLSLFWVFAVASALALMAIAMRFSRLTLRLLASVLLITIFFVVLGLGQPRSCTSNSTRRPRASNASSRSNCVDWRPKRLRHTRTQKLR